MNEKEAIDLLKQQGWGLIPPQNYLIDMDKDFLELWEQVQEYTMISVERAFAVFQSVQYICTNNIEGDWVECGVWKGGASMLAALCFMKLSDFYPHLWLYDTFTGMTAPDEHDRIAVSGQAVSERNPEGWWAAGLEDVRQNLLSTGYPGEKLHFIKGDVEETLIKEKPADISLLRLDTDWYASTYAELKHLYPCLKKGGVLLIDDYGHFTGARKAVDQYFSELQINPLLQRVDYTGRICTKSSL